MRKGVSRLSAARDRRQSGRLRASGSLACNLGTVIDLSSGGLRVRCRRTLRGSVKVQLTTRRRRLILQARVAWSRRVGFWKHEHGLQFVDVTPEMARELTEFGAYLRTG